MDKRAFLSKDGREITMYALRVKPELLSQCVEQTESVCVDVCKHVGFALQYVRNKTNEIEVAAVKQNGNAIQYVREQTPALQLHAVNSKPRALQFIQEPTESAKRLALKHSAKAIKYINNPTIEDYKYMLKNHWKEKTIKLIPNDCGFNVTKEINRMKLLYGVPK